MTWGPDGNDGHQPLPWAHVGNRSHAGGGAEPGRLLHLKAEGRRFDPPLTTTSEQHKRCRWSFRSPCL